MRDPLQVTAKNITIQAKSILFYDVRAPHELNSKMKTLRQANKVQIAPVVAEGHLRSYNSNSSQLRQLIGRVSDKCISAGPSPA